MRYLIFTILALSAVFGILQVFFVGLTSDTGLFMQQALMLWRGEGMYESILQVNAPFNLMIYAPLAALAAGWNLSPAMILHGFAFLVCLISVTSTHHVLKRHGLPERDRLIWCMACAFLLLAATPECGVFGDREHLLFAFALPWILQLLLGFKPLTTTAAFAAFGICMRPHNVILFAALTLTGGPRAWTLRQRLFSSSSLIILAIMSAYAASVAWCFPDYLMHIVPMAFLTYGANQRPLMHKLLLGGPFMLFTLKALSELIPPCRRAWWGFCLAAAMLFFLNSGWDYTVYLVLAPLVLIYAAPWCSQDCFKNVSATRRMSAILLAGLFVLNGVFLGKSMAATRATGFSVYHNTVPAALKTDLRAVAATKFILLSPSLWNTDIEPFNGPPRSVFAFDDLWTLVWLKSHKNDAHYPEVLRFTASALVAALKDHPDAPVIVDISPAVGGHETIRGLLEQDERVKALWSMYARARTIDYCGHGNIVICRFEIWRRQGVTWKTAPRTPAKETSVPSG